MIGWNRFLLFLCIGLYYTHAATDKHALVINSSTYQNQKLAPKVNYANNGTPIIDIATPNQKGLSHNDFTHYNVTSKGIVFNNNHNWYLQDRALPPNATLTQEPIVKNPNLQTPATTILAEVTGPNPTHVNGFTEIYLNPAHFILANPNGIYCDGAGFINIKHLTLTTSSPVIDFEKNLMSLHVNKGNLVIKDKGLSGDQLDALNIIAYTAKIKAATWIKGKLNIHLGTNQYAYDLDQYNIQEDHTLLDPALLCERITPGKITLDIANTQQEPIVKNLIELTDAKGNDCQVLLDAYLKGNISASQINIICAQPGATLRCSNMHAFDDYITINSQGNLIFKDLHAKTDLSLVSQEGDIISDHHKNDQPTTATNTVKIIAPKGHIQVNHPLYNEKSKIQLYAPKGTIQINHHLQAYENLDGYANHLHILPNAQVLATKGNMNLYAHQSIHNQGIIQSSKDIQLQSPTFHNTNQLAANKLTLQHHHIANKGKIQAIHQFDLTAYQCINAPKGILQNNSHAYFTLKKQLINQGSILHQDLTVHPTSLLQNNGTIQIQNNLHITTENLNNTKKGYIQANATAKLNILNQIYNQGIIASKENLDIETPNLINYHTLYTPQQLTLHAHQLHNHPKSRIQGNNITSITLQENLKNQGILQTPGDLTITARNVDNQYHIQGDTTTTLNIQNTLITIILSKPQVILTSQHIL